MHRISITISEQYINNLKLLVPAVVSNAWEWECVWMLHYDLDGFLNFIDENGVEEDLTEMFEDSGTSTDGCRFGFPFDACIIEWNTAEHH